MDSQDTTSICKRFFWTPFNFPRLTNIKTDQAIRELFYKHAIFAKATTYGVGDWMGTGEPFTVVDTPGFGGTCKFLPS